MSHLLYCWVSSHQHSTLSQDHKLPKPLPKTPNPQSVLSSVLIQITCIPQACFLFKAPGRWGGEGDHFRCKKTPSPKRETFAEIWGGGPLMPPLLAWVLFFKMFCFRISFETKHFWWIMALMLPSKITPFRPPHPYPRTTKSLCLTQTESLVVFHRNEF